MIPDSAQFALDKPLDPHRVTIMHDGPAKGSKYLTGQDVIETANRIFGYGGWGFELLAPPICIEREGNYEVWGAHGILRVEGGGSFSDFGTCVRNGRGASGLEMAIKGAVTDCVKRCLRNYGDQFGLVLYEKGLTMADLNREFQQGGSASEAGQPGETRADPVLSRPTEPPDYSVVWQAFLGQCKAVGVGARAICNGFGFDPKTAHEATGWMREFGPEHLRQWEIAEQAKNPERNWSNLVSRLADVKAQAQT